MSGYIDKKFANESIKETLEKHREFQQANDFYLTAKMPRKIFSFFRSLYFEIRFKKSLFSTIQLLQQFSLQESYTLDTKPSETLNQLNRQNLTELKALAESFDLPSQISNQWLQLIAPGPDEEAPGPDEEAPGEAPSGKTTKIKPVHYIKKATIQQSVAATVKKYNDFKEEGDRYNLFGKALSFFKSLFLKRQLKQSLIASVDLLHQFSKQENYAPPTNLQELKAAANLLELPSKTFRRLLRLPATPKEYLNPSSEKAPIGKKRSVREILEAMVKLTENSKLTLEQQIHDRYVNLLSRYINNKTVVLPAFFYKGENLESLQSIIKKQSIKTTFHINADTAVWVSDRIETTHTPYYAVALGENCVYGTNKISIPSGKKSSIKKANDTGPSRIGITKDMKLSKKNTAYFIVPDSCHRDSKDTLSHSFFTLFHRRKGNNTAVVTYSEASREQELLDQIRVRSAHPQRWQK